jgi:hypothetical protein
MNKSPESLWCWHWYSDWNENVPHSGAGAIAQFGHCRPTNLRPLDRRESESGALYIRADLVEKMKEK